ncbi:hypothetical protein [Nonomuraea typhae]|uniref:hypothetical protein n=1 Tax=Nonomuraea typhae TaxID=2603600 RepID=UPI001FE7FBA8|nr:hypothetical protein [Nonomuraea typhae]
MQVAQDVGQAGDVVAGVGHDEDVRLPEARLPGGDQPLGHRARWRHRLGPGQATSSSAVHELRPGSGAATNEYGQAGMNWARPYT